MFYYLKEKLGLVISVVIVSILGAIPILLLIDCKNTKLPLQKLKYTSENIDIKIVNNFKNQPVTWDSSDVIVAKTSIGKPVTVFACDNGYGGTTESGTVIRFTKKMQLIAGTGPNNEPWFWLVNDDTSVMKIFPHIFRNKL